MTILGILYWLMDRDKVLKSVLRATIFCISILMIPLSVLLTYELIGDYQKQLVFDDYTYRLEFTRRGIGEPCILPTLFVKGYLFEQQYVQPTSSYKDCLENVKLSRVEFKVQNDTQIKVDYFKLITDSNDVQNTISVIYNKK